MDVVPGEEDELIIEFAPLPDLGPEQGQAVPAPADEVADEGDGRVIIAMRSILFATLLLLGLVLFFVGFVLAPLIVLAVGYVIFMFLAPD